ncbi:hypothetical protein Pint_05475 [Pistacia integerrima]|uniref:Uncharacterized protein n=1 Tax=Pistacia integerrima TaxID=434235 RepID=A0ACC0Z101_9ROSI|nr:hypothetical protein Pint_05475 [Pistacia integerrima]
MKSLGIFSLMSNSLGQLYLDAIFRGMAKNIPSLFMILVEILASIAIGI